MTISASLVLFHNDPDIYGASIRSYLDGCNGKLYVVDNSHVPLSHVLFEHPRVVYIFSGNNLGFGAGHNLAIARLDGLSDFHLLLNPDITFDPMVLPSLIQHMRSELNIGAIMPQVVYANGELQPLCKLLPSPVDLIFRRFIPFNYFRNRINQRYELHKLRQDMPSEIPSLSGCFLLVRTSIFLGMGGFDERYFMYMEDVDLVRRIGDLALTVYDPSVSVTHEYAKGSYRSKKLLVYHLTSAMKYFWKWGWIYDPIRTSRNRQTLASIQRTSIMNLEKF